MGFEIKAFTPKQARQLYQGAERRDDGYRNFLAVMRKFYRTGVVDYKSKAHLNKPLWDQDSYAASLEAPNYAIGYINIQVANTAAKLPTFSIEPAFIADEQVRNSLMVENTVRLFMTIDGVLYTMRRMGLDSSIGGNGWGHAGWRQTKRKYGPAEKKRVLSEAVEEYKQLLLEEGLQTHVSSFAKGELEAEIGEYKILESRPVFEYISDGDVLLPLDVSEVEDVPWYCYRKIVRIDELKADDLYNDSELGGKPELLKDIKARRTQALEDEFRRRNQDYAPYEDDADGTTVVYHFWDVRAHRYLVFVDGIEEPIFDGENPNDFEDVCLVHLRTYRDGEALRGFGDMELIVGLLKQHAEVTREQLLNLKRQGVVWVAKKNVLSDPDKQALQSARSGDLVELNLLDNTNNDININTLIQALPVQGISADQWNIRNQLKEDTEQVMQLSELQTAGLGTSRMAATTTAVADGQAALRAQERNENYERCFTRVAELFLKLCQQYLDEATVINLVGPDGSTWDEQVELTKKDLAGQYILKPRPGTMAAINPATRAQRGMDLFGMAMQLAATHDVSGLLKLALTYMGVDPSLVNLQRLQPQGAEGVKDGLTPPGMEGTPMDPNSPVQNLPEGGTGAPMDGGDMSFDPSALPSGPDTMGTQEQMAAFGGPPLPGASGDMPL